MTSATKWKIGLPIAMVAFLALLIWAPWWLDGSHFGDELTPGEAAVVSGLRTALVAFAAAAVATAGVVYTHHNLAHSRRVLEESKRTSQEQAEHAQRALRQSEEHATRQAELTRQGQVNDRYMRAIDLLVRESFSERVGGIYALDRIMRESEPDHIMVVEVLAVFVRDHGRPWSTNDESLAPGLQPRLAGDVQAALNILGARPEDSKVVVDLRETYLRGADLTDANLQRAILYAVNLSRAILAGSNLNHANLWGADLRGAFFQRASLQETILHEANLRGAEITVDQLVSARPTLKTVLPVSLENDQRVKDRINEVQREGVPAPS
ncbi:pentapeptide repeat-containing protein [Streptomyces capitiformicae]|uniref:pentapeptide repeat-containing protein n=1 Tax=Streptomyces capitiformicae TaxID=2014920 RepID=UPI0016783709|nr:pentapeptide repeat-containing protein [Streptomyces capitiformicae]